MKSSSKFNSSKKFNPMTKRCHCNNCTHAKARVQALAWSSLQRSPSTSQADARAARADEARDGELVRLRLAPASGVV